MSSRSNGILVDGVAISEINARIPRRVRYGSTSARVLWGVLFVLLTGVAWSLWTSYDTLRNIHLQNILHRNGSMISGVVTEHSIDHDNVFIKYRFVINDAQYHGQAEMKTNRYPVPLLGEQIPILYLPASPQVNQPSHWEWFSAWDIFRPLYVLLVIVIAIVIISLGWRQRTLMRMGIVVEGHVTSCVVNKEIFTICYQFVTEDNAEMEGSTEVEDEYEAGTSVPVVYLRHNPKRNDRYPVAGFRVAE